jgi:hypothetical protein
MFRYYAIYHSERRSALLKSNIGEIRLLNIFYLHVKLRFKITAGLYSLLRYKSLVW